MGSEAGRSNILFDPSLMVPVAGLGKRSNGAFGNALPGVGNHQVPVKTDSIAKALAGGAGAVGTIEGEK